MQSDSIHTILHSAKRFLTGTVLSRITGLLRDIAMAAAFGTQDAVAAFLVAFRFAHLLRRLFGEGALQSAFIPEFEKLRKENAQGAFHFFQSLTICLTILLSVVIFLVMGGLGFFLLKGEPENNEILQLTFLLMPSLLFICLYGLNSSLLQCEKSYLTPSIAPAGFNLIWILGVGCLYHVPAQTAMLWLAGFVILACFCQWAITVPQTISILKQHGYLRCDYRGIIKNSQRIVTPLFLGIIGVGASQINNALDSIFARYASLEGPAYLWYAIRVQQLPLALFGIALSGAILPPLSRAAKQENPEEFNYFLSFGLMQIIALMLPVTFGIFILGDSAVKLLYGRGDFNALSALETADCLKAYGIGLIPMAAILIVAPAFYAKKNYLTPSLGSLYSVILNVILNALMIFGLGLGPVSVAYATSISAWFNLIFLLWQFRQTFSFSENRRLFFSSFKILVACVATFIGLQIFLPLWKSHYSISFLIQFGFESILFTAFFAIFCWLFRIKEYSNLFYRIKF